jgi:nicotinate-nucleotide pyrophosphorylase (carboxylating)
VIGTRRGALRPDELVAAALAEDIGDGDRTTAWTVPDDLPGRARIIAREAGVVAGTRVAGATFHAVEPALELRWECEDGEAVSADETVMTVSGPLGGVLTAERTALNFLARLSGIATLTARFAEAVRGTGCRVTDTRKTTPGWRSLEKAATAAGGAVNHRMGLYDMVLVKENHVRAAGGIGAALERVRERAAREGLEVEIEVTSLEELEEALQAAPDRILLDNMDPSSLRSAVERVRSRSGPRPLLEASGGVDLDSVREVAETGVDLVSVGALTHSAPALDLSLLVEAG